MHIFMKTMNTNGIVYITVSANEDIILYDIKYNHIITNFVIHF